MSYKDPSSENSQKVLYIYQIILNYNDFVKEYAQQNNNQTIYLSKKAKKGKKFLARLEDLIFKQAIKISKEQFQKKYEIDFRDSLGSGSYGDVYKVKNKHKEIIKNQDILSNMPDYYACKQICVSEQMDNISSSAFHEIEVLEKLKKYDYVKKLQNYIVSNRSTYLILDLAESNLQEQINQKQADLEQFNQEEIVKFLVQIGKTLALIYSDEGIVHRDLKPSNILIREENYYLSDFGCAQELYQSEQFQNNIAFGTLKWMSPELREMKRDKTINFFKSDIFSLGMILLYMLTLADISQVNCDEIFKQAKIRLMKNMYKDTKYSQIILLVIKMLETNPDHRPDSSILIQTIEEIQSQHQKNQ
ncbi:kinase domain protein (macronuclear) [Tetrahymena thermophila SB210]|uniref:Kinase domain protein n=1 Tax=Tetrahymena thermophila (strain SB210) TaxID=312017 RepID=Q22H20_TETTS|nr:kinase domain protein [Tetrahymena thermophila SB210]EAR84504.2 kinase domain protein [Tetrahymena thermophila SB210]|eukprot:XP_001032167.2 kinase domain protein [Tetrahymena thermophila SB210]